MKKITALLILAIFIISSPAFCQKSALITDYVNPFIGTGGHGHTYPGASLPFGMVQLSPDTRLSGWDGCSAYHASDSVIYGFSHTHLSGTGCSDYGDILLMPVASKNVSLSKYGYKCGFDGTPDGEIATAGYYRVELNNKVKVELTCSNRVGVHRYTFPNTADAGIVVDLKHRDKVLDSKLKVVSNTEIEGMRISSAWADKQILYFVARFSKPFKDYRITEGNAPVTEKTDVTGKSIIACFNFSTEKGEKIIVKVALSAVSCENARKNLEAEVPGWDFEAIAHAAAMAWNNELGKILVNGGTQDQKVTFYTSLYHAFLNPNTYSDVDGSFLGRDLKPHPSKGFDYYTVFSLWDTYRAAHPLFTIVQPKRTGDFINTFITQYEQGGLLPVWELSSNETDCMIGYHAVPVIVDAYIKGIRDFDAKKALEAMKASADKDRLGLMYYKKLGYIPAEKEGESVSKTLEYAYDDWCIAQMAKSAGNYADYRNYLIRAQSYKNLFDPGTGFMRAKINGRWFSPFDPAEVNFNYTEANAWQYTFCVSQDIDGLSSLLGGKDKLAEKLDAMFTAVSKTTGREQVDISGLIGQYAQGNEPSHHMAYLYDYAGEPWKTQELVHRICSELYSNKKDGLCGNEDCGQMSAWYVMSALGFYSVTPGTTTYAIGTPVFPEVHIKVGNNKEFIIKADNLSDKNYYIQSAKLNGETYTKCYIDHSDIMKGGILEFAMGSKPVKSWGTGPGDAPFTRITDELVTPGPYIASGTRNFIDSTTISLASPIPGSTIFYTTDGSEPTERSKLFTSSFTIDQSCMIRAIAVQEGNEKSSILDAGFNKIPKGRTIRLNTAYSSQYSAGGDNALIDMERGSDNFRTGVWQGYEGVDLDAVVDLGHLQPIQKITTGFLQDAGSWIFFPVDVTFYLSSNGVDFMKAGTATCDIPSSRYGSFVQDFIVPVTDSEARYVRVVAKNRGVCPPGHPGEGGKAWIFADEISVN
jgi:predicted alpha-1,2-mannosidase